MERIKKYLTEKNMSNPEIEKKYSRKLSFSERGHLVYDRVFSRFYCQFMLEGEGEIDPERLRSAVKRASDFNPGPRMLVRGFLNFSRLVDSGAPPPVRLIDGSSWDGLSSDGAPFYAKPLDPFRGPACEIVIMKGSPYRIVFRAHHAVMDGRGVHLWVEDIFKILNGRRPISRFSEYTELEFARKFTGEYRKPFPVYSPAPSGRAEKSGNLRARWIRRRITGHYKNLLGQIAVIIAGEVSKYTKDDFWIAVPVDLRFRNNDFPTTSNFASIIYINVLPGDTPEVISEKIRERIANKEDMKFDRADVMCRFAPLFILEKTLSSMVKNRHERGIYSTSASISNIGRIDFNDYTCDGFQPKSAFGCPSGGFYPVNVVLLGYGNSVEIGMAMPEVLASSGRMEALMERVVGGLVANAE